MQDDVPSLLSRRIAIATLVAVALTAGLFSTACDYGIAYDVENRTDQSLLTWPIWSDCDHIVGFKWDWLSEEAVQPREDHSYYHLWGGGCGAHEPRCVLVTTEDRRLVLAEPYQYQAVYTVTEPLQAIGDPLPRLENLPEHDWPGPSEYLRITVFPLAAGFPLAIAYVTTMVLALATGLPFATFIAVRFFYRYWRKGIS